MHTRMTLTPPKPSHVTALSFPLLISLIKEKLGRVQGMEKSVSVGIFNNNNNKILEKLREVSETLEKLGKLRETRDTRGNFMETQVILEKHGVEICGTSNCTVVVDIS